MNLEMYSTIQWYGFKKIFLGYSNCFSQYDTCYTKMTFHFSRLFWGIQACDPSKTNNFKDCYDFLGNLPRPPIWAFPNIQECVIAGLRCEECPFISVHQGIFSFRHVYDNSQSFPQSLTIPHESNIPTTSRFSPSYDWFRIWDKVV